MVRMWHKTYLGTTAIERIVTSGYAEHLAGYQGHQVANHEQAVLGQVLIHGEGDLFDGVATDGNAGQHDQAQEGGHHQLDGETVGHLGQYSEND